MIKFILSLLILSFCFSVQGQVREINFQKKTDGILLEYFLEKNGKITVSSGKSLLDCCVLYSGERKTGLQKLLLPVELFDNSKEFPRLFVQYLGDGYEIIRKIGGMGRGTGQFIRPMGCSVDDIGNVYIADSGNDRIQVFSPDLVYLNQFGEFDWNDNFDILNPDKPIVEHAKFNEPRDVVCRREIYISDWGNNRICRYNRYLEFLRSFGREGNYRGEFYQIGGITMDEDGYLYLADRGNDRIQKLDADGNYHFSIGSFGYGDYNFNSPMDVGVDSERRIYVLDAGNKKVKRYSSFGNYMDCSEKLPVKWLNPVSLKIFQTNIWVVDSDSNRIDILDSKLKYLKSMDNSSLTGGKMKNPYDIAFLPDGKIVVTCIESHQVLLIKEMNTEKSWSIDLNDLRRNL